jgi:hypothetical protein
MDLQHQPGTSCYFGIFGLDVEWANLYFRMNFGVMNKSARWVQKSHASISLISILLAGGLPTQFYNHGSRIWLTPNHPTTTSSPSLQPYLQEERKLNNQLSPAPHLERTRELGQHRPATLNNADYSITGNALWQSTCWHSAQPGPSCEWAPGLAPCPAREALPGLPCTWTHANVLPDPVRCGIVLIFIPAGSIEGGRWSWGVDLYQPR